MISFQILAFVIGGADFLEMLNVIISELGIDELPDFRLGDSVHVDSTGSILRLGDQCAHNEKERDPKFHQNCISSLYSNWVGVVTVI
jgi:hypothetical protein